MNENTDYMQQEELWDREGLLDPAWERQQRKVCDIVICMLLLPVRPSCGKHHSVSIGLKVNM